MPLNAPGAAGNGFAHRKGQRAYLVGVGAMTHGLGSGINCEEASAMARA